MLDEGQHLRVHQRQIDACRIEQELQHRAAQRAQINRCKTGFFVVRLFLLLVKNVIYARMWQQGVMEARVYIFPDLRIAS